MSTQRSRRDFNPFNLSSEKPDHKKRIKFERLPKRIKTKPVWWFIIAFLFIIILYWYLKINVS
jgi:hypothetical protein